MNNHPILKCIVIAIMLSTITFSAVLPAEAVTTYTKEALFSRHPQFLYNSESEKRTGEMIQAGVDILEAQSAVDLTIATLFTLVENGMSFGIRELCSRISRDDILSNQDTYRKEITQATLARLVNDSDSFISDSNATIKKYKKIKDAYKLADKAIDEADFCSFIDFSQTRLSLGQAEKLSKYVFSKSDGTVIKITGYAVDAWKILVSTMELYEIELDIIETLMENVDPTSDLGIGLSILYQERTADPIGYMIVKYYTDFYISFLAGAIEKAGISFFEFSGTITLVKAALTVFIKYGYEGATMDEVIKAYMLYSNVNVLSIALADCRIDMMKNGCTDGGQKYSILYNAYICAIEEFLKTTSEMTTPGEYALRGSAECNLQTLEDGLYISYDIHLKLCTEALNEASANGILGESDSFADIDLPTSNTNLSDRITAIKEKYPPNSGIAFSERYAYSVGSFAFVQKVFNLLYDCNMPNTTQNQFRYELYGSQNVNKIGSLREADMEPNNVVSLLSQAKPGDVLMGYGELGAHSMIVIDNTDAVLTVYDCDSHYSGTYSKNYIQEYEFSYSDIYTAFSTTSEDRLKPGIALYRAVNRERTYTGGTTIRYDDSVNFVINNGVLTGYNGYQRHIEIPSGVTTIGAGVFRDCSNKNRIYTVNIPESVITIETGAFQSCSNLLRVTIPNSVTTIGNNAFAGCTSLTSITIPDSVTSIGSEAFYNCKDLSNISFGCGLKVINGFTFGKCSSLTAVVLPDGLETIYGSAFEDCTSLESVYIPNSVNVATYKPSSYNTYNYPFEGCKNLKTVTFEEGISEIPNYLLAGSGLETLEIPDSVARIGNNAFYYCTSLAEITIPDSVAEIGSGAFMQCTSLTGVTIPDSVVEIGRSAFSQCTNLNAIDFGHGLTAIYESAFYGCSSLNEIFLPNSLTHLGGESFKNCINLTCLHIPNSVESTKEVYTDSYFRSTYYYYPFEGCKNLKTVTFEEGISEIPDYLLGGSGLETLEIPDSVARIGNNAFYNCASLAEITLPDSVVEIGSYALSNCINLNEIVIPDNVFTIGNGAFYGCTSINQITFGDGVTSIGGNAFFGCTALTSITLPDGLEQIYGGAFENCTALKSVYIPNSVNVATYKPSSYNTYNYPFEGCKNLKTVTFEEGISEIPNYLLGGSGLETLEIPDSVARIGNNAFYNCTSLAEITLPDSVVEIGSYAFYGCNSLKSIIIPDSVLKYGESIFQNCTNLETVELSKLATKISDYMFYGDSALKNVILPDAVVEIGSNCFQNCISLISFEAGNDLLRIGSYCFQGCKKLSEVELNDGLRQINAYAFQECTDLINILLPDSVISIGNGCFQKDTKLSSVVLSAGLTDIPSYAFANCTAITEMVIPIGVKTIGTNAFYLDSRLKSFTIPVTVTSIGSNAFSYASTTVVNGVSGSYAEGYAKWKEFNDITVDSTSVSLANGKDAMTIGRGVAVAPHFEIQPSGSTDFVMSLSSDNTRVVSIQNNTKLYGRNSGTANITATTYSGRSYTFFVTVANITGIEIAAEPTQLEFAKNTRKNLIGLQVNAVFDNDTKEPLYDYTVSGFITDTVGQHTVTVTSDQKTGLSATFDIYVENIKTGTMGDSDELSYTYSSGKSEKITVYGPVDSSNPVIVASYDNNGKTLSVGTITMAGESVNISVLSDYAKIFWIDSNCNPKCDDVVITFN